MQIASLQDWLLKFEALQILRRQKGSPNEETALLQDLDQMWETLSALEQTQAREETWRALPQVTPHSSLFLLPPK